MKTLIHTYLLLALLLVGCGSNPAIEDTPRPNPINTKPTEEAANAARDNNNSATENIHDAGKDLALGKNATDRAQTTALDILANGTAANSDTAKRLVGEVSEIGNKLTDTEKQITQALGAQKLVDESITRVSAELSEVKKQVGAYEQAFNTQASTIEKFSDKNSTLEKELAETREKKAKAEVWARFTKWFVGIVIALIVLFVIWVVFKKSIKQIARQYLPFLT